MRGALAALVLLMLAAPAQAQETDHHCRMRWDLDKVLRSRPDWERARYAAGGAIDFCTPGADDKRPLLNAMLYDPPRKDELGLCYFGRDSIDLVRGPDGDWVAPGGVKVGFYSPPGTLKMQKHEGVCPRQDDPGYVETRGVPDEVFLDAWDLWDGIRGAPERLPGLLNGAEDKPDPELVAGFKDWLDHPPPDTKLVLDHIDAVTAGDVSRAPGAKRALFYRIDIRIAPIGGGFFVDVESRKDGLKVVSVSSYKS